MESNVPVIESKIESYLGGFNLLNGIMKGIEQASREMTRERQRKQQQQSRGKGKGNSRQQSWEIGGR